MGGQTTQNDAGVIRMIQQTGDDGMKVTTSSLCSVQSHTHIHLIHRYCLGERLSLNDGEKYSLVLLNHIEKFRIIITKRPEKIPTRAPSRAFSGGVILAVHLASETFPRSRRKKRAPDFGIIKYTYPHNPY